MPALNPRCRSGLFLGLLLLAVSCSGCLKGDIFEYFAYDPAGDTFRFLQLETNIMAEKPADLDHLAELWKQREQIVVHPTLIRIFGLPAILRVDASHYKTIDLAQVASEEKPVEESKIPLDAIKNKPGKFFLSPDKTLCYFHEVTIGGKIVDQLLATQNKELCRALGEEIDVELKRRADGGKPLAWEEVRKETKDADDAADAHDAGAAKPPDAPPKDKSKPEGWPGDDASLKLLKQAAAAGEIAIRRKGTELSISFVLTPEDCRQLKTTVDLQAKYVAERAKKKAQAGTAEVIPDLHTEIEGGTRFVLQVDMKNFVTIAARSPAEAKPDSKFAAAYSDAIAAHRKREIPIDEKLTPQQVVDEFRGKK